MQRYSRQEIIDRSKFKKKVAIIGAGGIGGMVGEQLARAGLAETIYIYDFDIFEIHNINRQKMMESDVGKPKAVALANYLKAINSEIKYIPVNQKVANVEQLPKDLDIIFSCVDNFASRVILNNYMKQINNKCVIFDGGTNTDDAYFGTAMTIYMKKTKKESAYLEDYVPDINAKLKVESDAPGCTDRHEPAIVSTTFAVGVLMVSAYMDYCLHGTLRNKMAQICLKGACQIEHFEIRRKNGN